MMPSPAAVRDTVIYVFATIVTYVVLQAGTAMITVALYVLFGKVLPLLAEVISPGNRLIYRAIVVMTAFVFFLWGSGMRAMSMYPDPQWMFGLIGVAAFVVVLLAGMTGSDRSRHRDARLAKVHS